MCRNNLQLRAIPAVLCGGGKGVEDVLKMLNIWRDGMGNIFTGSGYAHRAQRAIR